MIAVMTNNNSAGLRKTLKSFLDRGEVPHVFDSTEEAPTRNENKEVIRALERDYRVKIRYASYREVATYAKELIKAGADGDMVEYAFLGGPSGFWNAVLLNGSRYVTMTFIDDRVQYRPQLVGSEEKELRSKAQDPVTDRKPNRTRKGELNPHSYTLRDVNGIEKGKKGRVIAANSGWLGQYPRPVTGIVPTSYNCSSNVVVQPISFIRRHCITLEHPRVPPLVPEEDLSSGPKGESVYGHILELSLPLSYVAHLPQCLPSDGPEETIKSLPETEALRFLLSKSSSKEEALEAIRLADWEDVCDEAEISLNKRLLAENENLSADPFVSYETASPSFLSINCPKKGFSAYADLWAYWPEMRKNAKIVKDKGIDLTVEL